MRRFVADFVAAELARLRRDPFMRAEGWSDDLSLERDLFLDSFEFMHIAGALMLALPMQHRADKDRLSARRTLGAWVDVAQAALEQHDSTLTLNSSGRPGWPTRCSHRLDQLEQEAKAVAALLAGRRRVLAAIPSHHIYGFVCTQLLPRHIGIDVGQVVVIRARLPSALAPWVHSGDLVIGHPRFWQAALAPGRGFPPDVVGISTGAACPDGVADATAQCGLAALLQLYGASGTGGLGWRSSHSEDYRLYPYLDRDPLHEDSVQHRLPAGGSARLQVQHHLAWRGERTFAVGPRRDNGVDTPAIQAAD